MASIYFFTKHEGFSGSIKTFTRDFVVTEIDLAGNLVSTSIISEDAPGCSSAWQATESRKQLDASPVSEKTECKPDYSPPSLESLDLKVILGQITSDKLEQFASSLKNGCSSEQDLSLGCFTDKHQRANVHRAVKLRFPFLMTITNQFEIKVKESQDYKDLRQLVSEQEAEAFFRFTDAKASGSLYTFLPDDNKEHRTDVHRFLSRRFGKLVETKSFTDKGRTSICVRLRERGRPKKRTAEDCRQEDIYTAFTLCKENLETLEAISYMAAELGVLPSDFTYAGIKDKRAITYQSMVVKKVSPERLKEKAAEFEKRGIRLFAVRSVSEPLKLGRLRGNHFDIVVRDIKPYIYDGPSALAYTEERVKIAVENVKCGFVNYYGPQRFGKTQSVQSDQIGLALLKEDMVSAVHLFFTPDKGDEPQNQAKRHFLQTGNAKEALLLMPESKARERLMLRAMNRFGTGPDGCAQAWLSLPHSSRIFYLHSYCSRVWNEAAAHRLSTLGHSVKQGDLVLQEVIGRIDDNGETCSNQIHVVTEQEERERVYVLEQVHLPMPGNTVKYPENAMATWYRERLAKDGLGNCRFRVNSLRMNVPGCYRPLLAFPRNLDYRLQRERGAGAENCTGAAGGGERDKATDSVTLNLTLHFDLFPSVYATVYLREVMKFMVN